MIYVVTIFIPPLYFLIRGKWFGFLVNSFFYGIAVLLLLSMVGAAISPLPWFVSVIHAMWSLKQEVVEKNTDMLARKMASAMRESEAPKEASSPEGNS